MKKQIWTWALLAGIGLGCGSAARAVETWYWNPTVKASYGYSAKDSSNFVNAVSGEYGLPVSGDFLIVRGSSAAMGADFGTGLAFGGVTVLQSVGTEFASQGQFTIQTGGPGLVFSNEVTGVGSHNAYLVFSGSGEAIVDVQNKSLTYYVQKSLYGDDDATLVKRGAGTLKHSDGYAPNNKVTYTEARSDESNYNKHRKFHFGGVKLQAGTLDMRQ